MEQAVVIEQAMEQLKKVSTVLMKTQPRAIPSVKLPINVNKLNEEGF